jgi:hypothetical protein
MNKYLLAVIVAPVGRALSWAVAGGCIHWSVFSFAARDMRGDHRFNYFKVCVDGEKKRNAVVKVLYSFIYVSWKL